MATEILKLMNEVEQLKKTTMTYHGELDLVLDLLRDIFRKENS